MPKACSLGWSRLEPCKLLLRPWIVKELWVCLKLMSSSEGNFVALGVNQWGGLVYMKSLKGFICILGAQLPIISNCGVFGKLNRLYEVRFTNIVRNL